MRLSALVRQGSVHLLAEVIAVVRDEVGQIAVFGMVPHLLSRVEFRGVGREPFHLDPTAMAFQIFAHDLSTTT